VQQRPAILCRHDQRLDSGHAENLEPQRW
jgi:hypothetical protein